MSSSLSHYSAASPRAGYAHTVNVDAHTTRVEMCYAPRLRTILLPQVSTPAYHHHDLAHSGVAADAHCYAPRVQVVPLPTLIAHDRVRGPAPPVPTTVDRNNTHRNQAYDGGRFQGALQLSVNDESSAPSNTPRIVAPRPQRAIPGSLLYYGMGFDTVDARREGQSTVQQPPVPTIFPRGPPTPTSSPEYDSDSDMVVSSSAQSFHIRCRPLRPRPTNAAAPQMFSAKPIPTSPAATRSSSHGPYATPPSSPSPSPTPYERMTQAYRNRNWEKR